MKDEVARVSDELWRRDVRHPRLEPGEAPILLDYHATPQPGEIVLVRISGRFKFKIAPAEGWVVGVVRPLPA